MAYIWCGSGGSNFKQTDSNLLNIIWRNKPHYSKNAVLCKPCCQVGLNVLDFHTSITSLKIKWLKDYMLGKRKMWYIVPKLICKTVGGIDFLLKCDFDLNKDPIQLSNFHRQVFLTWALKYKHNFSPHKYLIWNNRYIKYKNRSIYFEGWEARVLYCWHIWLIKTDICWCIQHF